MNTRRMIIGVGLIGLILGVGATALVPESQLLAQQRRARTRVETQGGVEVLTRGIIHEAFAEPVVFDPEPGMTVTKGPPEIIDELPPEERPVGDNVVWIPGYWSWDDDQADFIWVSGIWRLVPPGLEWVPGYWIEVRGGYQWVGGFWKSAEIREVAYLPEPPASIEEGPIGQSPGTDYIWAPGTWVWRQRHYVWRPGYYVHPRPGWIWIPARYAWTPTGYVFVDGFWDFSVRRRGVLFAPVYFAEPAYFAQGFTPAVVIDVNLFTDHLFVSRRHHRYLFGDFYAASYFDAGIYPWFAFHMSRYGYDPIYAYYNWHYSRDDRQWSQRLRSDFRFRRDHQDARPPHTFAAMERLAERGTTRKTQNLLVAKSFDRIVTSEQTSLRFEKLGESSREDIRKQAHRLEEFSNERAKLEKAERGAIQSKEEVKKQLGKSPVALKGDVGLAGKDAPPERPEAPQVDTEKKPKARGEVKLRDEPRIEPPREERSGAREEPREKAKPERPQDKPEPREKAKPERPKGDAEPREKPKTERPSEKAEPREKAKPERPKAEPTPREKAKPEQPREQPEPREKAKPQPLRETPQAKEKARPDRPKASEPEPRERAKPERAKPQPEVRDRAAPERPKADPQPGERTRPDRPKAESEPKARPERPRSEPEAREKAKSEPAKPRPEPRDKAKQEPQPKKEPEARDKARPENRRSESEPREKAKRERPKAEPERKKEAPKEKEKEKDERP